MKILITGSSGTIGTHLCERLLAEGHEIVGADWEPNQWNEEIESKTINADLRDEKNFSKFHTDFDLVVHLAANARVYELTQNPDRARDNFLTTFNTLEFARKNSIPKFIFASSRECYGNLDRETLNEDDARIENCESPYTASKVGGEALVHAYQECYDLDAVIIRFSNVYGMYDNSVRVVPLFIRQAKAGEPLKIFGKDKNLDFTHIEDAVSGVLLIIKKFDAVTGETLNLAYGQGTTILKLAESVKELLESDSSIEIGESRVGEITHYVADISKAKEKLGFDPQVPFDEGIRKAVSWYNEHSMSN